MNAKITGSGNETCLTLVLAHGYGGSQALWDNVVPDLSEKYQVLTFDWNFSDHVMLYGGSDSNYYYDLADELVALLEKMSLKGVVFVGHSMSGMVGCIASVARPELFSRLVLVGASPRYLNAENYEGGFRKIDIDNLLAMIETNFLSWVEAFSTLVVGQNDPVSIEKLRKDLKKMKPEVASSLARIVFLSDFRDTLANVKVPCTIVQSTNDAAVPCCVGNYMQRKIKGNASLEIIEMDGHFPQLTKPKVLISIIEQAIV